MQVASRYAFPAGVGIVDFYVGVNFMPNPAKKLWSCRCGCAAVAWVSVAHCSDPNVVMRHA